MGLSIHYKGRIRKVETLPEIIDEVVSVINKYPWPYQVYGKELIELKDKKRFSYGDDLYGIDFTPTHCETVSVLFLSNGRMTSQLSLLADCGFPGSEKDEGTYLISVKTQYAGYEVHQIIVELFQQLALHFLSDFTMIDESGYWENRDLDKLKKRFSAYHELYEDIYPAKPAGRKDQEEATFEEWKERVLNEAMEDVEISRLEDDQI